MKKILFATGNPTKAKRFSKGLEQSDIEVLSLKDVNMELDVNENGANAIENALKKQEHVLKMLRCQVWEWMIHFI